MSKEKFMTGSQGRQIPGEEEIFRTAEECRRQLRKPDKPVMDIRDARRIMFRRFLDASLRDGKAYASKAGGHKPE